MLGGCPGIVDHVVVGGGTAGAIVARRLADVGASVVLIEEGPPAERDERVLHLDEVYRQWDTPLVRHHAIDPAPGGNADLRISRAVVLGGCSSHNGCVAFAPSRADLDDWEALGATGWKAGMEASLHRVLSKVSLEQALPRHPCAEAFVEGSLSAGFPLTDFAKSPAHHGVGWHQLNKRDRVRQSSAVAYLQPLDRLPLGLHVLTNVRAGRLTLDGSNGVTGVDTDHGVIRSRSDVIVCAGALGSPELLLRSGIGAGEHLEAVGIPLRHELPGVGEHLIDHPEATVMWAAAQPVPTDSINHLEASLFASFNRDGRADVQVMFGTARLEPILQTLTKESAEPLPAHVLSMYPNVARARSQGSVRLRSSDPRDGLSVDPRYYTDPDGHDIRNMLEGIRLARAIAAQPALEAWIDYEIAPGRLLQGEAALARYARRTGGTVYHQAGTCRMGAANDRDAVVDPELRVRGLPGVRIADASIFPSMPAVNPCLTCMAVGERCSDLLSDHPPTGVRVASGAPDPAE